MGCLFREVVKVWRITVYPTSQSQACGGGGKEVMFQGQEVPQDPECKDFPVVPTSD